MVITESNAPYEYLRGEGFAALLRPGGRTRENGYACGDALLIEPDIGFFAVADSPDRNPTASAIFLKRLDRMLSQLFTDRCADPDAGKDEAGPSPEFLVDRVNHVIGTLDYNESTTFTGIMMGRAASGSLLMMHSGDSLLFHIRREIKTIDKLSLTNHCFAGRTSRLYQHEVVPYFHDSLLLLVTDGIFDIFRQVENRDTGGVPAEIAQMMIDMDISEFPAALLQKYDRDLDSSDDLALILVDPE